MTENGGMEQPLESEIKQETEQEERTESYHKLLEHGLVKRVAEELDDIYKTALLKHEDLDNRALDALKDFPAEGAIAVLKQFQESDLEHVGNKSAYLCGVMKAYRQKYKIPQAEKKGPDEAKLKEILDKSGYSLDVTTGQRKYGGPPPGVDPSESCPGAGHEVFCGKIPKDVFEDELIPLFEKCGEIWDLRLMMDPLTGQNRGYCFVTFCTKEGAQNAVDKYNNYEIKKGKALKVNISIANTRIFVGNIPKNKGQEEILEEFKKLAEGLKQVIIYGCADDCKKKNRGFAFLEYDTHKNASSAKRRLGNGRKVWNCDIIVDWADPQEEPDEDTMSKVKVLYVRNLTSEVTEEQLKERFCKYGALERVKKQKNYAFIHYEERDAAELAMSELQGQTIDEGDEPNKPRMEITLAKPQSEASKKSKEARKREQERQRMMMIMMQARCHGDWGPQRGGPMGRGMRRPPPPPMGRGYDYGYDYGYECYDDYRGGYNDPYCYGYEYYDDYCFTGGYGPAPPRRGRGGPPAKVNIPRGRGGARGRGIAPIPRGRGGMPVRGGGAGGMRGRGAPPPLSRGAAGGPKQQQQQRGGKRKMGGDHTQGGGKRRNVQENWGAQPIAQQPLGQSGFNNYGNNNDAQWYQDSYGQNWS
ncbi:heterogeneous nuclear ribonucleoprotein R-like [Tubulanus polymorphus]|uniref:heterogeneous nuclear ribonucleoprotein R-like n=1 Tax=Tubulanus polymorphus TaxID=672921 RepID=UPI003DA43065